jgi:hypothetical protein
MNRLFLVCALFGLLALGCSNASDPANQNSNKPAGTSTATQPTNVADAGSNTTQGAQGDVTGAYFFKDSVPGDFSEIDHLSLATINEHGNPAPLNGFIRPKRSSAKDYRLVSPKLDGKNLTFSTATVDGVGYSFTGAFEKLDNFSANPPPNDEVVLRGTLTKMKDGNVVAETKVNFTYSAGG